VVFAFLFWNVSFLQYSEFSVRCIYSGPVSVTFNGISISVRLICSKICPGNPGRAGTRRDLICGLIDVPSVLGLQKSGHHEDLYDGISQAMSLTRGRVCSMSCQDSYVLVRSIMSTR
jgi:hypothetical protein